MPYPVSDATAKIAAGQAVSQALSSGGGWLAGIQMPAVWTTADITLQGSIDGVTFYDVHDSAGNEVTITAAASQFILIGDETAIPTEVFRAMLYFKIRSGTSGSPVNQVAAAAVKCILVKGPVPGQLR